MKTRFLTLTRITQALAAAGLVSVAAPAFAIDYSLRAEAVSVTMPDGAVIPMWGFALDGASCATPPCAATVPGPMLTVPPGDNVLRIFLTNGLPEPVSIVIPGQTAAMNPVKFTDGQGRQRVRSFTHEAVAGGGMATYEWLNMRPGTYLYHSGSHPQVQVQMGLYGAVKHDAGNGQAYNGVNYAQELTLLFSEIDPALHAAVADGSYGGPSAPPTACKNPNGSPVPMTSTLCYRPSYFLINGQPWSANTAPLGLTAGQTTLLRFINAGLQTRVPVLNGQYMQMIAEDGNPYPWPNTPREQYSVFLPAAKTVDALLTPQAGPGGALRQYPLYDRRLALANAGAPEGGAFAVVEAGSVGNRRPVITSTPVTTAADGAPYGYQVTATDPDGQALTYALVSGPAGMTMSATGLISWTPTPLQGGANPVTVKVTDTTNLSAQQAFSITVDATNDPPVITSLPPDTASDGVLYSYQVAATDPEGGALTYSLVSGPAGMTMDGAGLVTWTPTTAQGGAQAVTVRATDGGGMFADQAYSITVTVVNDAPVAVKDVYAMIAGTTLTKPAPGVLANDTDADGDPLTIRGNGLPANGTLALAADGGFSYTPNAGYTGTDSFWYTCQDPSGARSNSVKAFVKVSANRPPVAKNDAKLVPTRLGSRYVARIISVLSNDKDPDTAIDPTHVIVPSSVTIVAAPDMGGVATVNGDGTVSYTPALGFAGTETFSYTVQDSLGATSNVATVTVTVD